MTEYHKIQSLYKRDMQSKNKNLIIGDWTLPEFEYLQDNTWVFTEKVDGTNIRIMFKDGKITFGGKTDNAQIPSQLVERLNEKFLPIVGTFADIFGGDACLYGEGYGAKIQKGGGNYRPDQDFVLFDVKIGEWWLERDNVNDIAQKLGVDIVPIIGEGSLNDAVKIASDGFNSQWGDFIAEGIVARPKIELKTRNNSRLIAKIKHRDFT